MIDTCDSMPTANRQRIPRYLREREIESFSVVLFPFFWVEKMVKRICKYYYFFGFSSAPAIVQLFHFIPLCGIFFSHISLELDDDEDEEQGSLSHSRYCSLIDSLWKLAILHGCE